MFSDRAQAGAELAQVLKARKLEPNVLLLALPRGGVPVAHEIAQVLHAPLDVMLVRKVGMPGQPELAIGAVASGGIVVREAHMQQQFPHLDEVFDRLAAIERTELERRERAWRAGMPPLALEGRTVILVDDGIATGATMLAAVRAARKAGASTVIAASPVAAAGAVDLLTPEADEVVILEIPEPLFAIGEWYERFEQLDDAVVSRFLALHRHERGPADGHSPQQQPA